MKKILFSLTILMSVLHLSAQTDLPTYGYNHLSIIRDAMGNAAASQPVQLRFQILNSANQVQYEETHATTTDAFGRSISVVGSGTATSGSGKFDTLNWSARKHYLSLAVKLVGATDWVPLGGKEEIVQPPAFKAMLNSIKEVSPVKGDTPDGPGAPWWYTNGNPSVNGTIDFLGTRNEAPLVFKVNNQEAMRIQEDKLLKVSGPAIFNNNLTVDQNQLVKGSATVNQNQIVKGKLGVGTSTPQTTLDVVGDASVNCLTIKSGCDWYEFSQATDDIRPGEVAAIDPDGATNTVRRSTRAYDPLVTGVVSGAGGINPGIGLTQPGTLDGDTKIAMGGKVMVRTVGKVEKGNLLTSSNQPGCAMAVKNRKKAMGAVLGKALSAPNAEGLVLMQVMMQ